MAATPGCGSVSTMVAGLGTTDTLATLLGRADADLYTRRRHG